MVWCGVVRWGGVGWGGVSRLILEAYASSTALGREKDELVSQRAVAD